LARLQLLVPACQEACQTDIKNGSYKEFGAVRVVFLQRSQLFLFVILFFTKKPEQENMISPGSS